MILLHSLERSRLARRAADVLWSRGLIGVLLGATLACTAVDQGQPQMADRDREPTAARSAPTMPSPSTDRRVRVLSAEDLFSALPEGHEYRSPPAAVEDALRSELGQVGKVDKIADLAMREVEYAGRDVAIVLAIAFNERATPADVAGVVVGMQQQTGAKARRVELGGKLVHYMNTDPAVFTYVGGNFVVAVFGPYRQKLERVSAAIFSAAP